jgi:putative heme-binding domain-containing protein
MAKHGRGRMPHLGSAVVDEPGIRLISDWIRKLPANAEAWKLLQRLHEVDETTALAKEKSAEKAEVEDWAYRYAGEKGRTEPVKEDLDRSRERYAKEVAKAAKERPIERAEIYKKLLASSDASLIFMQDLSEGRILPSTRAEVVKVAMGHPDPLVRDLFERFAPASMQIQRLGSNVVPEKLLEMALKGDIERGREVFFLETFQCGICHTVKGKGGQVGPDLSQVAARLSKVQILESILEPSKVIDPKFVTYVAETSAGQLHIGLLAEKSDREVVLRQVGNKELRLPARDVVALQTQKTSLMPDQLLRDATPQQAVDLLSFLQSLK